MPLNDDERANLVAYLDGELDDEAAQALEGKLNLDPEARAEVDALRQTWGLLDYLPKATPTSDFTHRTLERLSLENVGGSATATNRRAPSSRRRIPWLRTVGWAAAVVIAAGVGIYSGASVFHATQGPDPDEGLVRVLRVIEKLPEYQEIDDLDFLRQLAQPELFGEDAGS
jgi:anti-sigma factor RsiW